MSHEQILNIRISLALLQRVTPSHVVEDDTENAMYVVHMKLFSCLYRNAHQRVKEVVIDTNNFFRCINYN